MVLDEAVEDRLIPCASDLLKVQRPQLAQQPWRGVVSIRTGAGRARRNSGLGGV